MKFCLHLQWEMPLPLNSNPRRRLHLANNQTTAPTREAYIENVQWFSAELMGRMR